MITTDLLDDLERKAKALIAAPVTFHATESGTPDERHAERMWRAAAEDFRHALTPAAALQLVAIARERDKLQADLEEARREVTGLTADLERAADLLDVTGSPKAAGKFRESLAYRAARDKANEP